MRGPFTMPSYLREPSAAVCWDCDRDAADTVFVTLRTPTGGEAIFPLSHSCHDALYPAVAAVAAQAGMAISQAPRALLRRAG